MITTIIIVSSIVLAVAFTIAWLTKPDLRRRIESPKHLFADQVRQYDQQCHDVTEKTGAHANEPD